MNSTTLSSVEDECHLLLSRIKALRADEWSMKWVSGTQYTAAVRRQSMELTRALANLRKSV